MTQRIHSIDLNFRPENYFFPASFSGRLLSRIQGAQRRAIAREMIEDGRIDDLPELIAKSTLSGPERHSIGLLHPRYMGGEYLPDMGTVEVEIARIAIDSTTGDVTSIYASPGKNCIRYRVVDEYEGETLSERSRRWSRRPLTLGQLVEFFDGAWSLLENIEGNEFGMSEHSLQDVLDYVISVESEFYPDFGALYIRRITEWKTKCMRELEYDESDDPTADSVLPGCEEDSPCGDSQQKNSPQEDQSDELP